LLTTLARELHNAASIPLYVRNARSSFAAVSNRLDGVEPPS